MRLLSALVLLAVMELVACIVPASPALAATWEGDASQFWGDPNNWSTGSIPDNSDAVIIGAPAPTVIDATLGFVNGAASSLEVQSDGQLDIDGGRNMIVFGGTITNDGEINVNSNLATGNAFLRLQGGGTISGSGEIILLETSNASRLESLVGALSHGPNHTIRGQGEIVGEFLNEGTIVAEDPNGVGVGELLISASGTSTNNGVIRSSATGSLNIQADITHDPNGIGKIIADTQKVILNNRRFAGGTFETTNGGFFESTGNTLRFDGVHLTGGLLNMTNPGGTVGTLTIQSGGLTNDGVVQLGPTAAGASIVFASSSTIDGGGEIRMLFDGLGSQIRSNAGIVGTIGSQQTVRGVGQISAELVNNGSILAQPQSGTVLELTSSVDPKTNNGMMRADPNAVLRIRSTTVTQSDPNAVIIANGGTVELDAGGTVAGGRLNALSGGRFKIRQASSSGQLQDLVLNAPFDVPTGAELDFGGSFITNNNTITVNTGVGGITTLDVNSDVVLGGTGEVLLPVSGFGSRISVDSGFTLTQQAGHSIRGKGQINGPGFLENNGVVVGISAAEFLELNVAIGGTGTLENVRVDNLHQPGNDTTGTGIASVSLEGAYTINNFSTLEIEIGGTSIGTEFDQLTSADPNSSVTISGGGSRLEVLAVDLGNSYVPYPNDQFTIIESTNPIVGSFQFVELPSVLGNRQVTWDPVDYSDPNKVVLAIATVDFFDADFDEDGDVDGDDLTNWTAGYGTGGASHMDGDANGDGRVDATDFMIWQRQLGLGVSSLVAAVNAVPEPCGIVSCLTLLMCIAYRRCTLCVN